MWSPAKLKMPSVYEALPGRNERMKVASRHAVLDAPLDGPFEGCEICAFALGCFWGAERMFWEQIGVVSTQAGYAGGFTPNPTYEEVCSGKTGHAEVVRVVFNPRLVPFDDLLRVFWQGHDPTQGMRQGNDLGTQYRSAIFVSTPQQQAQAGASRLAYQQALERQGFGAITTEIRDNVPFYFAEDSHQQYLAKNPNGYCGLGGTGVDFPTEPMRDSLERIL
jgi:peptide-methionine (S)-S-oxide reductase